MKRRAQDLQANMENDELSVALDAEGLGDAQDARLVSSLRDVQALDRQINYFTTKLRRREDWEAMKKAKRERIVSDATTGASWHSEPPTPLSKASSRSPKLMGPSPVRASKKLPALTSKSSPAIHQIASSSKKAMSTASSKGFQMSW